MANAKTHQRPKKGSKPYERALFTLPPELMAETRKYATAYHDGNNSGFVAAAIRAYIDHLKKARHTAMLRDSYAASTHAGMRIAADWDATADDAWRPLDNRKR